MKTAIRAVSIPKRGHDDLENEDAAAYRVDGRLLRAAVADGATDSLFSGTWARTLVDGFVSSDATDAAGVSAALAQWREQFAARQHRADADVPWYVAHRMEEGAHAAFLGIAMDDDGWVDAVAAGDCCLFRCDGGEIDAWPLSDPDAFGHRLPLIGSRRGAAPLRHRRLHVSRGDRLVVATDAVAEWLMRGGLTQLRFADEQALRSALIRERRQRRIRNDDLTVMLIDVQ